MWAGLRRAFTVNSRFTQSCINCATIITGISVCIVTGSFRNRLGDTKGENPEVKRLDRSKLSIRFCHFAQFWNADLKFPCLNSATIVLISQSDPFGSMCLKEDTSSAGNFFSWWAKDGFLTQICKADRNKSDSLRTDPSSDSGMAYFWLKIERSLLGFFVRSCFPWLGIVSGKLKAGDEIFWYWNFLRIL